MASRNFSSISFNAFLLGSYLCHLLWKKEGRREEGREGGNRAECGLCTEEGRGLDSAVPSLTLPPFLLSPGLTFSSSFKHPVPCACSLHAPHTVTRPSQDRIL